MKRTFYFMLLISVVSCSLELSEGLTDIDNPAIFDDGRMVDTPYVYEEYLSKDKWKTYNSFDEKMAACQVPKAVASSLTTKALIQTCLNHPLAGLYLAYDNEFEIVRILISRNNAFNELICRQDAAKQLVSYYASMPEASLPQMHFLELLLGSGLFPLVFEEPVASELKKAAESQLAIRRLMPDLYSEQSRKTAELILAELNDSKVPTLTTAGNLLNTIALTNGFANTKAAGDLLYITTLYTPFGTPFSGYVREEFGSAEVAAHDSVYISVYHNATLIEHSSAAYECHSYAWNMQFGGATCWINDPNPYINERSFAVVNSYLNADVIYSSVSDFSAIPTTSSGVVISKWPMGPVMQHSLNESPFGTISSYTYYKYDPNGQYSSWPGSISGDDIAFVSNQTPYYYLYSYSYPTAPNSSFVWEVFDIHENPGNCTITANSNGAAIVFNSPGEYTVCCSYYVNGVSIVTAQYVVLALVHNQNEVEEPDEEE
jgi:hypothetical protein